MLYDMHEIHHAALAPLRFCAEAMQHFYTNPWVPAAYTRFGRTVAANCELMERTTRKYKKPAFGLSTTTIDGVAVAVREEKVLRTDFCTLLRFARDTQRQDPRLLIVAPMSGHYATLLRGTVEALLPEHDVYITDWIDAREVPKRKGSFDLDDYTDLVAHLLRHLGPNTHILAVCQPSVPVLAAVALMAADNDPCQPATMTLMGGPIDTRINPTKVNEFATSRPLSWFSSNVIHSVPVNCQGRGRAVYPGFLQLTGFMSMNLDKHVDAHVKLYQNLVKGDGESAESHREFYDEYLSVMDMPAEFYLQTIKSVFQDHALPSGTMVSRGRPVDPSLIKKTALMTVEGEKDDITGPGQCLAAQTLCSSLPDSMRRHHLQPKVGHYGIFNGRRWREEILPNVSEFIRSHDHAVLARKAAERHDPFGMGVVVRRLRQMLPA
ncbi:MAG TPA: polyhydroxyalkanoate depolymerase [Patescibacteria group bacterium]|nr:polyhydroxyalkanoate depolymerase [Patescibacteria group bacterium]